MPDEPIYMSLSKLSHKLGIHRNSLAVAVKNGDLVPSWKVGKRYLFTLDDGKKAGIKTVENAKKASKLPLNVKKDICNSNPKTTAFGKELLAEMKERENLSKRESDLSDSVVTKNGKVRLN